MHNSPSYWLLSEKLSWDWLSLKGKCKMIGWCCLQSVEKHGKEAIGLAVKEKKVTKERMKERER